MAGGGNVGTALPFTGTPPAFGGCLQIQQRRPQFLHLVGGQGGVMGDQRHLPLMDQVLVHGVVQPSRLAGLVVGIAAQGILEMTLGMGAHDHGDDVVDGAATAQGDEVVVDQPALGVHQQMGKGVAAFPEDQQAAMQHVGVVDDRVVEHGAIEVAKTGDQRAKYLGHRATQGLGNAFDRLVVVDFAHTDPFGSFCFLRLGCAHSPS